MKKKSRRKFQAKRANKGVIFALVVVLIGFGLVANYAFQSVFLNSNESATNATTTADNVGRSSASSGGVGSIREGSETMGGQRNSHEKLREAARDRDRQLMAKLQDKKNERLNTPDFAAQDYDAAANAKRVEQDYKQVRKAAHMSKGMKADFKKHVKNITRDITN